jgi:hypothetical protein
MFAGVSAGAAPAAPSSSSLLDAAGDLMARALSSSNVLTLNLTNVVILVILKIIIFVGGLFVLNSTSSTGGSSGLFGRSEDDLDNEVGGGGSPSAALTATDLRGGMCFLLFTSGAEDRLGCLLESACLDPRAAESYLSAANMWQQANQLFKK